jgi:hypothetical protein
VQKVVLDWSAAEADPALIRYSIRRDDVRIAVVSGQQHSYIDTEVQAGTPYTIVDPEICTTKRPGFGRMMA